MKDLSGKELEGEFKDLEEELDMVINMTEAEFLVFLSSKYNLSVDDIENLSDEEFDNLIEEN